MADHTGEFEDNAAVTATASSGNGLDGERGAVGASSAGNQAEGKPQRINDNARGGTDFEIYAEDAAVVGIQVTFDRLHEATR